MRKIKTEKSITIDRKPDDIYRFWRDFKNLPSFISHLESVRDLGKGITQWILKTPLGTHITWKARIEEDRKNERISWHSLPQSEIINQGFAAFNKIPGGNGTKVIVHISYELPPGHDNILEAVLLDAITAEQIQEDLRHLKDIMEKP